MIQQDAEALGWTFSGSAWDGKQAGYGNGYAPTTFVARRYVDGGCIERSGDTLEVLLANVAEYEAAHSSTLVAVP